MSEIKLQVGKTYRNRKGQKVGITTKAFAGRPPYQGDNGNWYTESGRWQYFGPEDPEDLVEEVSMSSTSQKYDKMTAPKLEVGKTYRSRSGEEIKITGFAEGFFYPYKGNTGNWYTENGRWDYFSTEDPEDLVAEVPSETRYGFTIPDDKEITVARYTLSIPDGAKELTVSQVGNRIVVEMVPEAKGPKPGDVMATENGSVYIFKSVEDNYSHNHYAWLGWSGILSIGASCYHGRPATPEEAQPLWDALKKAGKRWNAETMQVEDVPEKGPKPGDVMINKFESVYLFKGVVSHNRHSYFAVVGRSGRTVYDSVTIPGRPATPEEAQPLFDALKKAGKRWNPEAMQVEDDVDAMERCRIMDYLEGFANDETWNHEQLCWLIEVYLKRKEDEK